MSQTAAFELLGERLGLGPKSRAAYVAIDLGLRQPTAAEAAVLADWLGGYPVDEPDMATSGNGTTPNPEVAALTELVGQLLREQAEERALIREMLALARPPAPDPQVDENTARIARLEVAVLRLDPTLGATPASSTLPAPDGIEG